ncbi:MAG TPA: hypothetical protein VFA23_11660 [Dongiaceae bacterium]|nr:hypothetical protein [Dongiaceae bacterium]
MTFTAVILICSAALAMPDCGADNAIDVIRGPEIHSIFGCGFSSQAMIAQTALGPELGKDQYLKVICVEKERLSSVRRLHPA